VQGQAFLVTFCAIAKSDWPRAAVEREVLEHARCYSWWPFDELRANGRGARTPPHSTAPSPPAFAGAGSNPLPRGERGQNLCANDLRNRAFHPRQPIVNIRIRNIQRGCKAQNIIVACGQKHDAVAVAGLHEFACAVVVFFD
jgi:hypothetical protein